MSTRTLVLGGGKWQVDLIRHAKQLGLSLIVADRDPQSPGKALADEAIDIDTDDRDGLLAIARERGVQLVISDQTDRLVPIVAYLNEQLNLPGIRPETALRFTNKLAMRNALVGSGVPMPPYAEIDSIEAALARAAEWGYPVVLKPKTAKASVGVHKCDDEAAVRANFPRTLQASTDGRILVESFVVGPEITVEGFSLDSRFQVTAISEKAHYAAHPCVARKLAYPPRFDAETMARIRATAELVVTTLGLENGISHAEYRVRDGIPHLVEVAARGGGNRIASLITRHVSGIDTYDLLIRKLLGEAVAMPPSQSRAAILEFFDFAAGTVAGVTGLDEILATGLVHEAELYFQPGDTIQDPADDLSRLGYFITLGETRDEVEANAARVKDLVRVTYA